MIQDCFELEETMNTNFSLSKMRALPLPSPLQDMREWQIYIEFIETYFRNREIKNPMVVEIGTYKNRQRIYYKELLDYKHIGIDINRKRRSDIVGDSRDPETMNKLREKLDGQLVNLLYIDDGHEYLDVKGDYELYAPLVKNIIVLHDIFQYESIKRFWNELIEEDSKRPQGRIFITIRSVRRRGIVGTGIILIE